MQGLAREAIRRRRREGAEVKRQDFGFVCYVWLAMDDFAGMCFLCLLTAGIAIGYAVLPLSCVVLCLLCNI